MENIQEVHERIYEYLIEKHRKDPSFRFTTRITNRFGRLDKGYWFHGNEHYIAISFWTGTDWMNKTPNIIFVVNEFSCYLEISVWDSPIKRHFVDSSLVDRIGLDDWNGKYSKPLGAADIYDTQGVIRILDKFIDNEKNAIDEAVRQSREILNEDENKIDFIDAERFGKWTNRIEEYRLFRRQSEREGKIDAVLNEPYIIRAVTINNFPGINNSFTLDIPEKCQCVFLTGENGTGKSTILKAIGAALMNDHERLEGKLYDVVLQVGKYEEPVRQIIFNNNNEQRESKQQIIEGYAAYGPHRTVTSNPMVGMLPLSQPTERMRANDSLFTSDSILYDIQHGLNTISQRYPKVAMIRDRITNVIADIIPGFKSIHWEYRNPETLNISTAYFIQYGIEYVEDDSEAKTDTLSYAINDRNRPLTYNELATGAKSILAMLGDLMIRMYLSQNVEDVADMKGVVLIDEIDIHLHPTFQRQLVRNLTSTFKRIQFIISTHSPVPLLGAPDNAVFFVVKRNIDQQTFIEKIDNIHIKNLTPNNILTSPIFGMRRITSIGHEKGKEKLITDDYYNDYIKNEETKQRLKEIAQELKKRMNNDL